tara:strand:+ start:227 stop:493 length:267 start_codon:yes stop_codon:yes gene_type:complete
MHIMINMVSMKDGLARFIILCMGISITVFYLRQTVLNFNVSNKHGPESEQLCSLYKEQSDSDADLYLKSLPDYSVDDRFTRQIHKFGR